MLQLHDGQCGLCAHFGEGHAQDPKLIQIRTSKQAPEQVIDDCGHPKHAQLNLKVAPHSGCTGFVRASVN